MTELDKDEQFYRDTETIAFPKLDDRELAMLEPLGARCIIRRGELVFKAGQRNLGLTAARRAGSLRFARRAGANPRDFGPARFHWERCDAYGNRSVDQCARQSG